MKHQWQVKSPKPSEFGQAGQNWEDVGWRVRVAFRRLDNQLRPKEHIDLLRPLLPERYSLLLPNGNGLQSVYLTEVPDALAEVLVGLVGEEARPIQIAAREVKPVAADDLDTYSADCQQQHPGHYARPGNQKDRRSYSTTQIQL